MSTQSGDTPEVVALRLFDLIATVENKAFHPDPSKGTKPDVAWILRTYAACIAVVKQNGTVASALELLKERS